jgi:hypothetical protein
MNGATVKSAEEELLRRAIELAATARKSGNPPFGSLLAGPDGTVIAEDHNTSITDSDISAHPELKLAKWSARELDPETAAGVDIRTVAGRLGHGSAGATTLRSYTAWVSEADQRWNRSRSGQRNRHFELTARRAVVTVVITGAGGEWQTRNPEVICQIRAVVSHAVDNCRDP